jgi:hypothetical protein
MPLINYVDEFCPVAELAPITGLSGPVDIGIDLHGNGIASRRILAQLAPLRLIGFGSPTDGLPGPDWRPAEHEIRRWCRLVWSTLGSAGPLPYWEAANCVAIPELATARAMTLLHPGAAYASRRWPPERFIQVARQLADCGHDIVITGSGAERALVRRIAGQAGVAAIIDPPLPELFALVAAARLLVSGDTGLAHVATNYRTPSIILFGPVSPATWGPPSGSRHLPLFHGDGRGDPHGGTTDPALLQISVEEVMAAAEHVEHANSSRG